MDCRDVAPWLLLRPDAPEDQAALDAHLRTCPTCAARFQRAATFDHALQSTLMADPPPALTARLLTLAREAAVTAPEVSEVALSPITRPGRTPGLLPLPGGERVGARGVPRPTLSPRRREGWRPTGGEGAQLLARPTPSPRWGEGRSLTSRRRQLAALTVATALATGLWTLVNPEALPAAATLIWGIVISLQIVLSSPAGQLLASPSELLGPLLPMVAAFLLAGVLAHEVSRPPRPRRTSAPSV